MLLVYIIRFILTLSYHLRLFHPIWSLPFPFPHQAATFISLLLIAPPPHLPRFDHLNNIWLRVTNNQALHYTIFTSFLLWMPGYSRG